MSRMSAPQLKGMVLDEAALTHSNSAPQLNGMILDSDDQNTPSSFLGNIGNEVENFANDSSGIGGLFLPGLAQQMVNNPTPVIQNQLQMSMAYPPALLQKIMMASGGIPSEALAQGTLGIGGHPSIKTVPAAIGQYLQGGLKASTSPGSMLGILDPELAKRIRSGELPLTNYNINKGLNVPNTPLNNMTEAGIRQAIPIAGLALGGGELPGEGLSDESLSNFKTSLQRKIGKLGAEPEAPVLPQDPRSVLVSHDSLMAASRLNQARNTLESAHGINGIHGMLSSDYLNTLNTARGMYRPAFDIHGDKIPDFLQRAKYSPIDINKSITLKNGQKFSSFQLKNLQSKYPQDFEALQKQYNFENGNTGNPVKDWLGDDDYNLGNSYAKKEMNNVASNPSIKNNYELKEALDRRRASLPPGIDKIKLGDLSDRINQEGIISPLEKFDSIYGTNTAVPYKGADKFFRENVGPYRANKAIYNVATGVDTKLPLGKLSDAIDTAQRTPSKYRFDQDTGLPLSQVSENHALSTKYKPTIDKLINSVDEAKNNYDAQINAQSLLKNNMDMEHKAATDRYKEQNKNYQSAMAQRQKQIEDIKNAPSKLKGLAKKAGGVALTVAGLDWAKHIIS